MQQKIYYKYKLYIKKIVLPERLTGISQLSPLHLFLALG